MTLQEILDTIYRKFPHSNDNATMISMIDDIQKRIFRTIYKPVTTVTYDILADNPFYPVDFSPETIIDVVVNGEEYPYQNIKYGAYNAYYYITEDNCVGLYPTPTEDVTSGLTVFHYQEPSTLTSTSDTPDLPSVWHMLLVYQACRELAVEARDEMVNVFVTEINQIEAEFRQSRPARPHRIHDVYGVGRGAI